MNKRELRLDKYGISSKRYKELCGFCEQYPDWKKQINEANATLMRGMSYDDMPKNPNMGTSDTVGNVAVRMADLQSKCNLIEEVAKQADAELWQCIIKSVCYEVSPTYLIAYEDMPLSKSAFYERRRYFFYLLDKERN